MKSTDSRAYYTHSDAQREQRNEYTRAALISFEGLSLWLEGDGTVYLLTKMI